MMQIVKQTDEEKIPMYLKLPKKRLAEMLVNCNNIIDTFINKTDDEKSINEVLKIIEARIFSGYGKKCKKFDLSCGVCLVWRTFDDLKVLLIF